MYTNKINTARVLAKHLGIPKNKFVEELRATNEETAILQTNGYKALDHYKIYCSDYNLKNITPLLNPKKRVDPLFNEWSTAKGYLPPEEKQKLVMCFCIKTLRVVMYYCPYGYDGLGGFFLGLGTTGEGHAIEPIENWLAIVAPRSEE
jgi:hypothetical protein